jgi:DNA-binding transcriptional regulator YdaS (Cro superfamily)
MSQALMVEVIAHFGSQRKTADKLDLTQPTVNHMLTTGQISAEAALKIQKESNGKFLALDLRPSLRNTFTHIQVA